MEMQSLSIVQHKLRLKEFFSIHHSRIKKKKKMKMHKSMRTHEIQVLTVYFIQRTDTCTHTHTQTC